MNGFPFGLPNMQGSVRRRDAVESLNRAVEMADKLGDGEPALALTAQAEMAAAVTYALFDLADAVRERNTEREEIPDA